MSELMIPARGMTASDQFDTEEINLIKTTVAVGASDLELKMFLYHCRKAGLDPILRQVHFVKRGDKATIQTGIDGYRLIADRTGKYAGNDDAEFVYTDDSGFPAAARVTVWKLVNGARCAFTATARWSEYAQQFKDRYNGGATKLADMWARMPHTMLAKCAESQALRKAFPAELAGIYTHEEMQQADALDLNTDPAPVRQAQAQAKAATTQAVQKAAVVEPAKPLTAKECQAMFTERCKGAGVTDRKEQVELAELLIGKKPEKWTASIWMQCFQASDDAFGNAVQTIAGRSASEEDSEVEADPFADEAAPAEEVPAA